MAPGKRTPKSKTPASYQHPESDEVLDAYKYRGERVNRTMLNVPQLVKRVEGKP
jgi:hypothetical protein